MSKLLRNHWFDNQVYKLLEKSGFLSEAAGDTMKKACRLAALSTGCKVSMVLLPDYQTMSFWSGEPLHPEVLDQLIDLAHLLKEADPEFGLHFSEENFFRKSSLWNNISGFKYFNFAEIKTEEGNILGWFCLLDTEKKYCQKKDFLLLEEIGESLRLMLATKRHLETSLQIQSNLVHFTAHDLRNPLAGILSLSGHIPVLRENPEEIAEITRLIQQSARQMLQMLEEVLHCGQLESGKVQLKVSPANFNHLLLHAIEQHRQHAERKGQRFSVESDGTETTSLMDYNKMTEVLDNLLSNAVKFAPPGAEIKAKTTFQRENNALEFSLYNPGTGLSEEDKSRIFQKFSKLSAKPTGGESSTGLGLSIVRTLTEMHGGSIRAESEGISSGVRFILQLPASRVA